MSIGENVKALRLRKGLTQSQLANASGMQLTQVSRIENNDTDPKASTLAKIIQALDCTANDIFDAPTESAKMNLEDFIDSMDMRTGMDMKTVVLLWRILDNHQLFIQQVRDTYKNEPHPHAELVKRMQANQG